MISYKPLLHLLVDKDLELTNIIINAGLSKGTVTNINNNNYITLATLEKIYLYLRDVEKIDIKLENIFEFIK